MVRGVLAAVCVLAVVGGVRDADAAALRVRPEHAQMVTELAEAGRLQRELQDGVPSRVVARQVDFGKLLEDLLEGAGLPQLDEIVAMFREALADGFDFEKLRNLVVSLLDDVQLDADTIEELREKIDGVLPMVFSVDGLREMFKNLSDDLKERVDQLLSRVDIPELQEIIEKLRDAINNGLPEDLQDVLVTKVSNGELLTVEEAAAVEAYDVKLPDSIVARQVEDFLLNTLMSIFGGDIPQLDEVKNVLKELLEDGIDFAALKEFIEAVMSNNGLDSDFLETIQDKIDGELPVVLTMEGLMDFLNNIREELRDKVEAILDANNFEGLSEVLEVLRDAIENGLPEDLQDLFITAVEEGGTLDDDQVRSIEAFNVQVPDSLKESDNTATFVGAAVLGTVLLASGMFFFKRRRNQRVAQPQLELQNTDAIVSPMDGDFHRSKKDHYDIAAQQRAMFGETDDADLDAVLNNIQKSVHENAPQSSKGDLPDL